MPRWALYVVDLWLRSRSAAPQGMFVNPAAAAPLPCAGTWQDQPAALMDAFGYLDGVLAKERG